jgi:hypothetical protein
MDCCCARIALLSDRYANSPPEHRRGGRELRWLRDFLLIAHPPLLCSGGEPMPQALKRIWTLVNERAGSR